LIAPIFTQRKMPPKKPLIIPALEGLEGAVKTIRAGGIIAYPTESSYALGVDPANAKALKNLFRLKGRPADKAMPLIAGDMAEVRAVTSIISPLGHRLIKGFWPGPLTLIFEATDDTPKLITGKGGGIGLRIPSYPLCQDLTKALGQAITSTSANPAGKAPALDAIEAQEYFKGKIDLILDGGRLAGNAPSTVVDVRGAEPIILREGSISTRAILKALKEG